MPKGTDLTIKSASTILRELTLSAGVNPASPTVLPGTDLARMMTVSAGRRCLESSEKCGPAGKDDCAELGAAWAAKVPIMGLNAKGEDLGLMRKMAISWYHRYNVLLDAVKQFENALNWEENIS